MQLDQSNLEAYLSRLSGQTVQIESLSELGGGTSGAAALKALGYGQPLRIDYRSGGQTRRVVLRRVKRNGFGRERHADRIAAVWLDFHTFNHLPQHVHALDLVGLTDDGDFASISHVQDLLLLTDYGHGTPYADDLLRIRDDGQCSPLDVRRAQALAAYLAEIHAVSHDDPLLWRRRLRDLIGHGEGIMGLTDSYTGDDPLATADVLRAIEEAANGWRWQLKPLTGRLCQVHGDFHPFNVLFDSGESFSLLDRSRGEWGEAADDVSCMAINYLFFSLQRYARLDGPFRQLHTAFWESYRAQRSDDELCQVIQPWFAWRALVLASPQWYPNLDSAVRAALLTFARKVLAEETFEWRQINRYLVG